MNLCFFFFFFFFFLSHGFYLNESGSSSSKSTTWFLRFESKSNVIKKSDIKEKPHLSNE